MVRHEILGGLVQVYKRGGKFWHCSASVDGPQHGSSTKEEELATAIDLERDLQARKRRG